jgi:hypothetical protein
MVPVAENARRPKPSPPVDPKTGAAPFAVTEYFTSRKPQPVTLTVAPRAVAAGGAVATVATRAESGAARARAPVFAGLARGTILSGRVRTGRPENRE